MSDAPMPTTINLELAAKIVAAYVRRNPVITDQLGTLISTVHQALADLGKPATPVEPVRTPAVPIRRSFHRDYVVCLDCGWRGHLLRRHIAARHGLSVDEYRARWRLSRDHPVVAPEYSERRSGLAKHIGFGLHRRETVSTPPTPAPRRRGRSRATAAPI